MPIVDVMQQAFVLGADGWWLIFPEIEREAGLNIRFAHQVLESDAYSQLVAAGIDGKSLMLVCTTFHAIENWRVRAVSKFKQQARYLAQPSKLRRGRPFDQFGAFQVCCDMLVSGRRDGRGFHGWFTDLAAVVYGRHITVSSYCRMLKVARAKLRQTPTPRAARV